MQESLFDLTSNSSWFKDSLFKLDLVEKPGWPDDFGAKFHNWFTSTNHKKIRTLSLFSGGGGLDIAFHDMGFDIVECVEIEKEFAATLIENSINGGRLGETKVVCKDIRSYSPECKNIQFIIGGPPCQTFSAAGARASGVNGTDDSRGTLFEEYVRILKQIQPVGFLFENVYRIVGAQEGKPWALIQEAFQGAGYKLFWRILDAADYGVPQHRERLIIVGVKDDTFYNFPQPTHGPDSEDQRPYYTAGQAVLGIDASTVEKKLNGRHGHLLEEIPPGLNYSYYTERMNHPKPIFGWRSKFSDYLYKADPETPVRTIKAQGGQYTGPFSWENRPFTVEEIKRLQTFPDEYRLKGGRQVAIHQLGNSVPPQLGRILAASILNQIFKIQLPFELNYLHENKKLGFRKRKSSLTEIYKNKATIQINKNKDKHNLEKLSTSHALNGHSYLHLSNDFQLVEDATLNSKSFNFEFKFSKSQWKVFCYEKDASEKCFSISIELAPAQQAFLGTKKILLESASESPNSLLAIWKFLEVSIKQHIHKDDLIQVFGYYQYKGNSNMKATLFKDSLKKNEFWNVILQITAGIGVGQTLHIDKLCETFNLESSSMKSVLVIMKTIGFEIRNTNTNKQIKADNYLIPYPFPTLNERSLQRLTQL